MTTKPKRPPVPHPDRDPGDYRPPTVGGAIGQIVLLWAFVLVPPVLLGYSGAWSLRLAGWTCIGLALYVVALVIGGQWLERRERREYLARQWAAYEASSSAELCLEPIADLEPDDRSENL